MTLDLRAVHAAAERLATHWREATERPGGLFDPRSLLAALPSVLESFDDPENTTAEAVIAEIGDGDFDQVLVAAMVLGEASGAADPPRVTGALEVPLDEPLFVHGDLHVKGDLAQAGMIVVTGDLRVDGLFWDADVGNQLVVLGNTRLGRLNLYGGARLAGDLDVDELLYGIDHSDTLQVRGDVRAKLVILEDTQIVARSLTARLLVDPDSVRAEIHEDASATVELLVPEAIGEDGIDVDVLLSRLAGGQAIWR